MARFSVFRFPGSRRLLAALVVGWIGSSIGNAQGEVVWRGDFETGNLEQWKGATTKNPAVRIVTEPVRAGKYALRIDGSNAAERKGRDRIELQHQPAPPGTTEGTERFFGWSVYVPQRFVDGGHQVGYFETRNSWRQLMAWEVRGEDISISTRVPYARRWSGPGRFTPGRWHDFAVHVLWSRDPNKGFVEMWFDGEQVVPRTPTATLLDENPAFFQLGLMRESSPTPETIYLDHVVEGTTLADVTPPPPTKPAPLPQKVSQPAKAQPARTIGQPAKSDDVAGKSFLDRHCRACHGGEKPKGDFSLAGLTADFTDAANRKRWLKIVEQVRSGDMPPADRPRPTEREKAELIAQIDGPATEAERAATAVAGRTVLRRLNRAEYVNTIRDLLDVDVELKDLLPPDTSINGFDNNAESMHTSSYLMESYLEAADRVLDAAIASRDRPTTLSRRFDIRDEKTVKPSGSVYRHVDDGVAVFSSWVSANIQVALWQFQSRERGRYRFRISGYAYQTQKPITFHVVAGPLNAAAQQTLVDYFEMPPGAPTVVEFTRSLDPQQTIRIIVDNLGITPTELYKIGAEKYTGPGLVLQWVEVEGPLVESWPPRSHRLLFGDMPQRATTDAAGKARNELASTNPQADAERVLRDFARRAFRRPVTDADLKPFLARVQAKLDAGATFDEAIRVGLRGVLVSPHFLFFREKPGSLDDYALASRLSYFLWSSLPDDELFALAAKGELRRPEVLRAQVERLLADPRAAAFTENFAGQWLGLRAIDATMPDRMLYPEFDDVLKQSSVKEVLLFFNELLRHDLSLTNFVAADFAIVNGRLAQHYGIPGVEGLEFQKVKLAPDSRRGGVLTMAGILKITANGTTTSPVLRGAWVLERILGTPPPKPTIDVEAVEPDIRGATTIREQLAAHRARAECASCHVEIDPPGFALENYDVIGGWRERYRSIGAGDPVVIDGRKKRYLNGPAVDAADVLPDGRSFRNIDEYKKLLLADKDQLARSLTEKLLTYATGATPTPGDRAEVEAVIARVRAKNYGFRSLVHEVVQSAVFQTK